MGCDICLGLILDRCQTVVKMDKLPAFTNFLSLDRSETGNALKSAKTIKS